MEKNSFIFFRVGLVQKSSSKTSVRKSSPLFRHWLLFFRFSRKQKRETLERCRREVLDKSQRTDGESNATGSSTPSAGSSSSISSVGQETSTNNEHSLSTPHHLVACPTISTSTTSSHSENSRSDSSPDGQSAHSPSYSQQPLALTTTNARSNNNTSFNHHPRKETFPINHIRQQPSLTANNNNNTSTGPYLKL